MRGNGHMPFIPMHLANQSQRYMAQVIQQIPALIWEDIQILADIWARQSCLLSQLPTEIPSPAFSQCDAGKT